MLSSSSSPFDKLEGELFAAIDFETADHGRDSACAVAIVFADGGRVVERFHQLIRPPRRDFYFSYLHGITWAHVAKAPSFSELWPSLERRLRNADFLAAHNAPFDRSVLKACCADAGQSIVSHSFICSMKLARAVWDIHPTRLPDVCSELGIPLRHHDAASDAEACARILIAARREGISDFGCTASCGRCNRCEHRSRCLFTLAER